jgi:hypothetical protein
MALCFGGYAYLVEPVHHRLGEAQAAQSQCESELRPAEGLSERAPDLAKALDTATREASKIDQLGRPARDERNLFASIMSLAQEDRVRVDQMTPVKIPAPPRPVEGQAVPPGAPAPGDVASGYSIMAVATYSDLARFVREVRSELGYSRVRSLHLVPLADETVRAVRSVIEIDCYAFDTAPEKPQSAGGQP